MKAHLPLSRNRRFNHHRHWSPAHLALLLGLAGMALTLLGPTTSRAASAKAKKGPAPAVTNAPVVEIEIPQSVFVIPASSREGRNPFFPRSTAGLNAAKSVKQDAAVDASALTLNGINFGPKPTVMVNNRTLEKGEQTEIKLATGAKVLIKCEDIKSDSAVILVNGTERRELRLRAGL